MCKKHIQDELGNHSIICGKEKVTCVCGEVMFRYLMSYHTEYECTVKSFGCPLSEFVSDDKLKLHKSVCAFSVELPSSDIAKKFTVCYYCSESIIEDEFEKHSQTCDLYLDSCEGCGMKIQRLYMTCHLQDTCSKRIIHCEYCKDVIVADVLPEHLEECELIPIICDNKCGAEVARKTLKHHLSEECPKRIVKCKYCTEEMEARLLCEHHATCLKYPVHCPEECGIDVRRENLTKHKDEECIKLFAHCSFKGLSCNFEGSPYDLRRHVQQDMHTHVNLMNKTIENLIHVIDSHVKRINDLEREKDSFVWPIAGISGILSKFKCYQSMASPPFYSSKYGGYKLQVLLYPRGITSFDHQYLSVAVQILRGEHDAILEWPFKGKISIKLVDQSKKGQDVVRTSSGFASDRRCKLSYRLNFQQPEEGPPNFVANFCKFLSLESLKTGSFISCDKIYFEVSVH